MEKLLEVCDLEVDFATYGGEVHAVRGVSFHVDKGECVAIVGESDCGKSVTAKAIMRLIPTPPGNIKNGKIFLRIVMTEIIHLLRMYFPMQKPPRSQMKCESICL